MLKDVSGLILVVYIFIIFVTSTICAILSGSLAEEKGYPVWVWIALGFFFGLFGLIAAAGLPIKNDCVSKDTHFECPICREFIKLKASKCRFCGHQLSQDEVVS